MRREKLKIIDVVPFRTFKEKIALTKKYKHCRIQVLDNCIYIERWIYE